MIQNHREDLIIVFLQDMSLQRISHQSTDGSQAFA